VVDEIRLQWPNSHNLKLIHQSSLFTRLGLARTFQQLLSTPAIIMVLSILLPWLLPSCWANWHAYSVKLRHTHDLREKHRKSRMRALNTGLALCAHQ
jgi:hypothetical protein